MMVYVSKSLSMADLPVLLRRLMSSRPMRVLMQMPMIKVKRAVKDKMVDCTVLSNGVSSTTKKVI